MVTFGALSYSTIIQVKIGSAAFDKLSLALDVQGDFTPPTQFAVQERVLVYQARTDVADKVKLEKEFDHLKDLVKGFRNWP